MKFMFSELVHSYLSESLEETSGPESPVDNSVITKDLLDFIADWEY